MLNGGLPQARPVGARRADAGEIGSLYVRITHIMFTGLDHL